MYNLSSSSKAFAYCDGALTRLCSGDDIDSWELDPVSIPYESMSQMTCIAKNIFVSSNSFSGELSNVFVSPSGDLLVTVSLKDELSLEDALAGIALSVSMWDIEMLDGFSKEYTFDNYGQASCMIDTMCKLGYLTYKDRERFEDSLSDTLSSGTFVIIAIA